MPSPTIVVDPFVERGIRGHVTLDRIKYFGLCHDGRDFDIRCQSEERYRYLIHENGITFGRKLGVVKGLARWSKAIREDPQRPGHVDVTFLRETLARRGHSAPSDQFRTDMGGRLDVAAHGQHNAFPEFMGKYLTPQAGRGEDPEWIPENLDAAAELSAAALRYDYNDFDRPRYYEPVNEPHWSYPGDRHFCDWHLKTLAAVHRATPKVEVGGPCLPVAYFYGKQYQSFKGLKAFIEGTQCGLDFYSFHCYDYLREVDGDFGGRITSGLPLESVLDLVEAFTVAKYDREVPLVFSEHGGYGAGEFVEALAREHFPGQGFEWEMKKRTIDDFNMVSSALANTLVFLDHPHVVAKAVPFILLESMGWDPRYYAVLFTPYNYQDKSRWVPTQKILFYRFLRDLRGNRVRAVCADPDLQVRAFVEDSTLRVVMNNLSAQPQAAGLGLPGAPTLTLRRLGRNDDFTPYLTERRVHSLADLTLKGREAVMVAAEYPEPLRPRLRVEEVPCYGDSVVTSVEGTTTISVRVPTHEQVVWATLRVGISRPAGLAHEVAIVLNGTPLPTTVADCASRLEDEKQGFATCKLINIPASLLREENTVAVSFPDGRPGSVGAVVIRAAMKRWAQDS